MSLNPAVLNLKHRADLLDRVEAHRDQVLREFTDAMAQVQALQAELVAYGVLVRRRRV